jgi:hypothetical protein
MRPESSSYATATRMASAKALNSEVHGCGEPIERSYLYSLDENIQ